MKTRRYQCRRCGQRFEAQVFERGEAEEKRVPTGPVCCPDCRSPDVEPVG